MDICNLEFRLKSLNFIDHCHCLSFYVLQIFDNIYSAVWHIQQYYICVSISTCQYQVRTQSELCCLKEIICSLIRNEIQIKEALCSRGRHNTHLYCLIATW